ncbi:type I toxin-antitoxin system Ibs family toxin [Citrobacter sp. OP27]
MKAVIILVVLLVIRLPAY